MISLVGASIAALAAGAFAVGWNATSWRDYTRRIRDGFQTGRRRGF